jgi:hypothetical protein
MNAVDTTHQRGKMGRTAIDGGEETRMGGEKKLGVALESAPGYFIE